ncbi:MAG: 50S ribosomal protein L37ae [Candidatus Pacearchaeota archaeon]|nr:50S ribosomal protein L37ae [Candidatus Pacearchaeota archaeon]
MGKTKKVGASGRFGVRYGSTVKEKWLEVEKKRKERQRCPFCKKLAAKRIAKGLWQCKSKSCGKRFTGGAYALEKSIEVEQNLKTRKSK